MLALGRILITLLLSSAPLLADSHPSLRLTANPRVALSSGVRVEWFIPRHPDHRAYRVEVDGDSFYRATEGELEGEGARATFNPLVIDRLPEGNYTVTLTVQHGDTTDTIRTSFCRGSACVEGAPR